MSILPEKLKRNSGFTLVETLVSLVILTMALIPILQLTSSVNKISTTNRDDLIAAGLVQEGIEVVRAIRDTNWYNNRAFDSGLAAGTYLTDWSSMALFPGAGPLKLNNGVYSYTSGTSTKFYRTITITKVSAGELKVVCQVQWLNYGATWKITSAEDHLFNWK
jgi:prepilin-type N-terminal cleavage/methylation domain-containing protein